MPILVCTNTIFQVAAHNYSLAAAVTAAWAMHCTYSVPYSHTMTGRRRTDGRADAAARAPGTRAGPGRVQVGTALAALPQDCNLCKASHASLNEAVTESRLGDRTVTASDIRGRAGPDSD
jgi:hypothetical protein